ncbi:MAG TPA: penicillin-binding protein activator LpoB [Planctomycetaceae bacterium]|nr:penicillin-binding protein activator LpoB [Planctomycetaceae bacterium]
MERRTFLGQLGWVLAASALTAVGCRNKQYAHVLNNEDRDMVGSHTAGAETWEPLVQESVSKLLGRQHEIVQQASAQGPIGPKRICFVGVENRSIEEMGDFREQIYQKIDACLSQSHEFEVINKRYVEAGLHECGLRPDQLFVPRNRDAFVSVMEQTGQPFDYLLYATITSGTTTSNQKDYQRDYLFTLELVDMQTGHAEKEQAELRKGYHKSKLGSIRQYGHK